MMTTSSGPGTTVAGAVVGGLGWAAVVRFSISARSVSVTVGTVDPAVGIPALASAPQAARTSSASATSGREVSRGRIAPVCRVRRRSGLARPLQLLDAAQARVLVEQVAEPRRHERPGPNHRSTVDDRVAGEHGSAAQPCLDRVGDRAGELWAGQRPDRHVADRPCGELTELARTAEAR